MKKVSLILNIILLSAVILLYVDRFAKKTPKKDKVNNNTSEAIVEDNADVVYIQMDSLISGYDLYNVLSLELMDKQKEFETQLNSKMLSYQNRTMKLQSDYEKHVITSANYQKKGEALMMEQQQIAMWREQKGMELMEDEQNLTLRILDSIINVVNEYNRDEQHKLIINNSFGGVLLYAGGSLNITDTILVGLNSKVEQAKLLTSKDENN